MLAKLEHILPHEHPCLAVCASEKKFNPGGRPHVWGW